VDCDPVSYNIAPDAVERAITPRTRAIVPVHLFGQPADMDRLMGIARARGLKVVEDACQAHGAWYRGRRAGTFGEIGCFSFYPGKNLGAYGDGGAAVTDDPALADRLRMLRDYGQPEKYRHVVKGFNSRLDGLQAAILNVKLKRLDEWNRARFRHAAAYTARLRGLERVTPPRVVWPEEAAAGRLPHVFHLYVIRVPERARVQQALADREIQTGIHYPIPVHLQPAFEELGYRPGAFPVAERCADEVLSLPMFPELTEAQIAHVCESLEQALT
jgi:dTDP-4-amino-4,6-dideoxygalactose transaminase